MAGFSLEALLNPRVSRVEKTIDNLNILVHGPNGSGKTPALAKMPKPHYVAFSQEGISAMNNIPFTPINSWSEFVQFTKTFTDPKNYEALHEMFQTVIIDEMEVLYKYCEKYVANSEGVNKIKEGNGGYGLWGDLKSEWEAQMLKWIGSEFCVVFILHSAPNDAGVYMPVGDEKRMLPVLKNHCAIIGFARSNGVDPETGKEIHSSLQLVADEYAFARTRNEYFDPIVEDFTGPNLIKAYYTALERQEKAEGVEAVTKEERTKLFQNETKSFDELMDEVQEVGAAVVEKYGSKEKLTEIVDQVLGKGKLVSQCGPKQAEQVAVIINELKALL